MEEMRLRLFILTLLTSCFVFGKTTYISADKLPVSKENDLHIQFVRNNEKYFTKGAPQVEIGIGKVGLVEGLKSALSFYTVQDAANLEVNLLLGDISAYLSYMKEPTFFDAAVSYYKKAIQLEPMDYRAFWFLGTLYYHASDWARAVDYLKMAQTRLPKEEPVEFWEKCAQGAYQASMPTTCLFAMDRARALLNRPSDFEREFGASVRSKITGVSSAYSYTNKELWSYTEDSRITFTSRALGASVNIEPEWELNISGFEQKKATFTIFPPAEAGPKGQALTYSISIQAKVASEDEDLKTFMDGLVTGNPEKSEVEYSDKYPGIIAYELKDAELYKEHGGSHQYLIGIKRKEPPYPGLSFEQPLGSSTIGELENAWPVNFKNRFSGNIFYILKLDTPEDIFIAARRTFWDIFNNHLHLE